MFWNRAVLFFAFVALLLGGTNSALAQSNEQIESTQIFVNADFIFVAQIEQLKKHLSDEGKEDFDHLMDMLSGFTGFDGGKCTEAICQFGADDYGSDLGKSVGFLLRQSEEFTDEVVDEFVDRFGMSEEERGENSYFKLRSEPGYSFRGNSILIAECQRIETMFDEQAGEEQELEILDGIGKNEELTLRVNLEGEKFDPALEEMLDEIDFFGSRMGGEGVEREGFDALAKNATRFEARLELKDDPNLEFRIALEDSSNEAETKEQAQELVNITTAWIDRISEELQGAPDGFAEPMTEFLTVCSETIENASIKVEQGEVVITGTHDSLSELPNLFARSMRGVFEFL